MRKIAFLILASILTFSCVKKTIPVVKQSGSDFRDKIVGDYIGITINHSFYGNQWHSDTTQSSFKIITGNCELSCYNTNQKDSVIEFKGPTNYPCRFIYNGISFTYIGDGPSNPATLKIFNDSLYLHRTFKTYSFDCIGKKAK